MKEPLRVLRFLVAGLFKSSCLLPFLSPCTYVTARSVRTGSWLLGPLLRGPGRLDLVRRVGRMDERKRLEMSRDVGGCEL
jgi:hypothetical protein